VERQKKGLRAIKSHKINLEGLFEQFLDVQSEMDESSKTATRQPIKISNVM
jgi:hypothetical protein